MLPPLLLVLWRCSLSCDSKIFMARRRNKEGNVFLQSLEVHPFVTCRIPTRFRPLKVPPHASSFTLGTELVTPEYMNLWRTLHVQTPANSTCLCKMGWLVLRGERYSVNRTGEVPVQNTVSHAPSITQEHQLQRSQGLY